MCNTSADRRRMPAISAKFWSVCLVMSLAALPDYLTDSPQDLKGDVTRFPLCRKPTYVIVEIPGHPRFHTYSLPAEVPPVRQWQGVWSLDQIIDNFAPPEGNSDTVVVQVQWIEECIRAGKVLGSDDEWGGWRVW